MSRNVVIVAGVRTPIGSFGGSLKDIPPTKLAASCVREAVARAKLAPTDVQSCVFGNIIHTEARDMYMARVAAIEGGLATETPALTVNRLCGSGLQAIVSAAQQIRDGDVDVAVAGGAESMSRAPYAVTSQRWGQKMGDSKMVDMLLGALHDPFGHGHMGMTAENVSRKWQVTREQQDAFALESQRRAVAAVKAGYFDSQILPVQLESRKGPTSFARDEQPREDVSADKLSALKPVFKADGTVTPGNASTLNDGAATVVLMEESAAARKGLKPMARLLGYAHAAVAPGEMGIGPIPAVQNVMRKTGLTIADMDVIESNEAFAAQALAVAKDLGFPPDKTNPNGGAIALGHPIGATGTIVTIKAMYELQRTGKRYGLITLCIGGGQGIAAVVENLA